MRPKLLLPLVIFIVALAAWAGDPWKQKPYHQWDEKDVRKVLNDSPWAKSLNVSAPWMGAGPQTSPGVPSAGAATGVQGAATGPISGGPPAGSEVPTGTSLPEATYLVRWTSATILRQAIARGAVLRGAMQQADVEKALAQEAHEYQVMVLGPDMTPFTSSDEFGLKEKAYLRAKKSKVKISPSRVEIRRSEDGKKITSVLFWFPKKAESGGTVFTPDEKGIEFNCQAAGTTLRANFDPQKMVGPQGLDL